MSVSSRPLVQHRFCALESVDRNEPILGTATESNCYLLVECSGQWPSRVADILVAPGIPERLSTALRRFIEWCPEDVHPLLIRQPGRTGAPRVYIIRSRPAGGRCLTYRDGPLDFLAALQDAYSRPAHMADIALVCTHGKRDKCCAKFGEPVYDRFAAELANRFTVFQCSHLGGDRFAANVLWLPHGVCLGHVHIDLSATIDKLKTGSIPLSKLRGSAWLPSAAQYLEGVWRNKLALERPDAFELEDYRESDVDGRLLCFVSLRDLTHRRSYSGHVSIHRSRTSVLASCNTDGRAFPRVFELVDPAACLGTV